MNAETLIGYLADCRDLTERHRYMDLLVGLGAAAIPDLLGAAARGALSLGMTKNILEKVLQATKDDHACSALERGVEREMPANVRLLAIERLHAHFADVSLVARTLWKLGGASDDNVDVRSSALRAVKDMALPAGDMIHIDQLLRDPHASVVLSALDVLESKRDSAPAQAAGWVEKLVTHTELHVRCRALAVLGIVGEIDVVERVCMLPLADPMERDAAHKLLEGILTRPRNVMKLSPFNFEQLVKYVLDGLKFQDVEVTGRPGDGGVDVVAYRSDTTATGKSHRARYIVQCKRHKNEIGRDDIEKFIAALRASDGAHNKGLFVTTALFSRGAMDAAKSHAIELIDGKELQGVLDERFPRTYIIRGSWRT